MDGAAGTASLSPVSPRRINTYGGFAGKGRKGDILNY
jgi:hypothetical protein